MDKLKKIVLYLFIPAMMLFLAPFCSAAPVMVDKNLFSQDRKPPSPDQAPATPQSNRPGLSPKSLQLDGVFIHGDNKKALIRVKGNIPGQQKKGQSPYMTIGEGETVGDYRVSKIERRSISLEKDGQEFVLGLFAEGKVVPPPPPTPSSPAIGAPGSPHLPQSPSAERARANMQQGQPPVPGMPPQAPGMPPGGITPPPSPGEQIAPANNPNGQEEEMGQEEEFVDDGQEGGQ